MRSVYVAEDGATLRRDGDRLVVSVRGAKHAETPTFDVEQVVVLGNVMLTPAVIDLLVGKGIDVVMLTKHGRFRARVVGGGSSNVKLRMQQILRLADDARAREIARAIVDGKIANQRAQLLRHARRHGAWDGLAAADIAMRAARARLELTTTLDEVRGCEGSAAAAYFRAFPGLLRNEAFSFPGRSRRPPTDPVNALLSLGYTLLLNAVAASVRVVGLDPDVGALHAPLAGRPSLVCDLMEELRAPVVDALVVSIVNQRALAPEHFDTTTPDEGVTMTREGLRHFVTLFERRLDRTTHFEPLGKAVRWRQLILEQCRKFARWVLEGEAYVPYAAR